MGEVLALSWPASLSMLNSTLMRFADGLMVSFIGTVPFSAQLVGGMAAFVPESFATGLLTVVNTYVAQNFGAKRFDKCGQYAWAGIFVALFFCLMVVPLIFLAKPIFAFLNQGTPASAEVDQLISLEAMYFQYMVGAIFLTLTARPLEQFFYGIQRPRVVLAASLIANGLNIVLGYILIFGTSGLAGLDKHLHTHLADSILASYHIPAYGLEGGAWGNLISWALYLAILLAVFLSHKMHEIYATRRPQAVKFSETLDLAKLGWPAGVQFINDMLPWSIMLAWLVGSFGPAALAATSAAMRWMPLSFMPAVGIGVATTALVGRYLGQRNTFLARRRVHAALVVALVYMGVCGIGFWLYRYNLMEVLITVAPSPEMSAAAAAAEKADIIRIGGYVMICAAIFQLFDAVGIVFIGALRGAGDTFWPMILTFFLSWGLTVGGGWAMKTAFPQLGSIGPWIAASLYVIVLGLAMAARFNSGAWKKIDLLHRAPTLEPAEDTIVPQPGHSPPPARPAFWDKSDTKPDDGDKNA